MFNVVWLYVHVPIYLYIIPIVIYYIIKLFTSFTSYCGYEIKENYSILKTSKAGKSIFANAY
jgi:hypothetical protein